jgi:hypothetical protein
MNVDGVVNLLGPVSNPAGVKSGLFRKLQMIDDATACASASFFCEDT